MFIKFIKKKNSTLYITINKEEAQYLNLSENDAVEIYIKKIKN